MKYAVVVAALMLWATSASAAPQYCTVLCMQEVPRGQENASECALRVVLCQNPWDVSGPYRTQRNTSSVPMGNAGR
jgi:hypothetical protein